MVINALNKIIGKPIIGQNTEDALTCRKILYPYFNGHFYVQLGTSIIFGSKVDSKSDQLFLPSELYNNIQNFCNHNSPK